MDCQAYSSVLEAKSLLLEVRQLFMHRDKPSTIDNQIVVAIKAIETLIKE